MSETERAEQGVVWACWAVLLTALAAAAIIAFGPPPTLPEGLFDPSDGLREPRDRAWYLAWLLLPPALLALAARWPLPRPGGLALPALALAAGGCWLLASDTPCAWPYNWHALGGLAVAAGCVGAWLLPPLARTRSGAWVLGLLGAALVAHAGGYLRLAPDAVPDPFHFAMVSDEVLAASAGRAPLAAYTATYTTGLGWPLAPLVRGLGLEPLGAACTYLWALTLATLACTFAALVRLGGWRHAWIYALAVGGVPLLTDTCTPTPGLPVGSYLPVWPTRLLAPAACLLAFACWRTGGARGLGWPAGLGALAVGGLLVNVEFGLVNALALLGVLGLLAARDARPGPLVAFAAAAGGTALAGAGLFWALAGQPPDLGALFAFLLAFGGGGFAAVAMPAWGLATVAAGFATLCLALAGPAVWRADRDPRLEALVFTATFALGSLAYYTGRSLDSVLATSSGLPLAWCAVLWTVLRLERPEWPARPTDLGGRLALGALAALPLAALLATLGSHPWAWRPAQAKPFPRAAAIPIPRPLPPGVATFARNGNLWLLREGLPSSLAINHPWHLIGPAQGDCFCEGLARDGRRALLVEPAPAVWHQLARVATRPACWRVGLTPDALARHDPLARSRAWTLVPLTSPSGSPPSPPPRPGWR